MDLHQAVPLQVIDKVGYLITGNDANDLLYDAMEKYINSKYVDPERQQRLDTLAQVIQADHALRTRTTTGNNNGDSTG
jgi:CHASE3 domain sensor protein